MISLIPPGWILENQTKLQIEETERREAETVTRADATKVAKTEKTSEQKERNNRASEYYIYANNTLGQVFYEKYFMKSIFFKKKFEANRDR